MKICSECGKELMDKAVICPGCGCPQTEMKKCTTCGQMIMAKAVICPKCGCLQENTANSHVYSDAYQPDKQKHLEPNAETSGDKPNMLVNIISFFLPLIGYLIFIICACIGKSKRLGNSAAKWAGWGVITFFAFFLILGVLQQLSII